MDIFIFKLLILWGFLKGENFSESDEFSIHICFLQSGLTYKESGQSTIQSCVNKNNDITDKLPFEEQLWAPEIKLWECPRVHSSHHHSQSLPSFVLLME